MTQTDLFGMTDTQKMDIATVKQDIREIEDELNFLRNADEDDISLIALNLERYGDQRVSWFFLSNLGEILIQKHPVQNPTIYCKPKNPPSISDYNVISDWEAYSGEKNFNEIKKRSETEKFVQDRIKWAVEQRRADIKEARSQLKKLKKKKLWDTCSKKRRWENGSS